jgi:nitroreductase
MNGPENPVLEAVLQRRSIRHFSDAKVERDIVLKALEAASWAPSGLNNQPWRFALIWDPDLKAHLGGLTRYSSVLRGAAVLVGVFLDRESSYDYVKDCQAIGAAVQNLLVTIHSFDLGAVWIGEILKNKDQARTALGLPDRLELMAVICIGEPAHRNQTSHRKPLEDLLVFER